MLFRSQVEIIIFIIITLFICLIISLFFYFKTRKLKNRLETLATQLQKDKVILKASEKELMIAKDNAEKANQLKSKFVSNISHEIRTPLNAIVGFSSLLVNNIDVTNEQKEYAQIIHTNSDLLLQLITDVLEISRLESDKLHFNYEQCHIAYHCNNIITFTRMNKKSNIDIEFIHDLTDDFNLYTDSLRLQQVITNLLNNALKFTPEGGKIILTLDTDLKKGFIYFSVKDSGIGVPVEKHKTIFERFEKLDEFIQGTGLGLSICKLIINQMGGDIWVDEKYNEGACFVFSHPIYQ